MPIPLTIRRLSWLYDADRRELAGNFGFSGVGDGYMKAGRPKDALRAYDRALQTRAIEC